MERLFDRFGGVFAESALVSARAADCARRLAESPDEFLGRAQIIGEILGRAGLSRADAELLFECAQEILKGLWSAWTSEHI
jgi:hypothetical protein